jgi:methyl-accepting chemotaxis protein
MTTDQPFPNDPLTVRLERIAQAIEDLTSGIAQIAEDARTQRIDLSALRSVVEQQAAIAVQQAESVSRLTLVVERQAQLVERLLDRGAT